MTYEETLDYLYTKLPMYQRVGSSAYKKDLTNIIALCNALDNPQNTFKSIHIAGTNGKGSSCHMLSAIYQHNGYKVGLYTSPHLVDFRERIRLNGEKCSKQFVVDFVFRIRSLIETLSPSFFEITVAMAFSYFAEQKVDVAVVETGLGGRLDSTNIVHPICTGITSIGFDHTDMLGDTLEKIAFEKAGIIKPGIPVILGQIPSVAEGVIREQANNRKAPVHRSAPSKMTTDIKGEIQRRNAGFAMEIVGVLHDELPSDKSKNIEALQQVKQLTGLQGRMHMMSKNPLVISDVAHNEEGISLMLDELNNRGLNTYFILGFVKEKSLDAICRLFPRTNNYYFVKPNVQRGRTAEEVLASFKPTHPNARAFPSIEDAIEKALIDMSSDTGAALLIGGSNFLVADLLHLKEQNKLPF